MVPRLQHVLDVVITPMLLQLDILIVLYDCGIWDLIARMKEMFSMDLLDLGKFYFMTHVEYYFDF